MIHGDGDIFLIYYENNKERFCYVVMQKDISDCDKFKVALNKGIIKKGEYYDWETPYGYGGPLCEDSISKETQRIFINELKCYCVNNNIVSQFLRFHPLLENNDYIELLSENRYMRDTIFIDTSDKGLIMKNMDSKNRNMIRKAMKNNVSIVQKEIDCYDIFIEMYENTMKKNKADEYYFFKNEYYEALELLKDNVCIFFAMYDGKPVSAAIMFYNENNMHYHLSGSDVEYRQYAPSNLLLYEAALWANKKGIKKFHLGGGISPEDNLFGFKKQFNKNGRLPFFIGRTIFDEEKYQKLMQIRKDIDDDFDLGNMFMIQYRR